MKKILAFLLIICIMTPYSIFAEEGQYTDSTNEVIFSDNFESEQTDSFPSTWALWSSSTAVKYVTAEDPTIAGNKVFQLTRTSTNSVTRPYIPFSSPIVKDIDVQFRFYNKAKQNGASTADTVTFMLRGTGSKSAEGTNFSETRIRNTTVGSTSGAYTAEQWNTVNVKVNIESWTIAFYINGSKVYENGMNNHDKFLSGEGIGRIVFDAPNNNDTLGTTYIDDVVVSYDHSAELQLAADSLTFDKFTDESQNEVSHNLSLPDTIGENNKYTIEWSSENEEAVSAAGAVTRRSFTQNAVINARIKLNDDIYINKQFDISVLKLAFADDTTILKEYAEFALSINKLTDEPSTAITHSFSLPKDAPDGITVTWSSDNEAVVDNNGNVSRPSYTDDDANVSLSLQLALNETTYDVIYNITVVKQENPYDKLEEAMNAVTYESITNESSDSVTKNLLLPNKDGNGTKISWISNNETVIGNDGKVTRMDETQSAVLTASFDYNGYTDTKEYHFTVLLNSTSMIKKDLEELSTDGWDAITESFYLPKTGEKYGTQYQWVSSDTTKIQITSLNQKYKADVIRPVYEIGDCDVTISLTAINEKEQVTRDYTATVLAQKSDKDIVDEAYADLTFDDLSNEATDSVTLNMSLPVALDNDVTVSWSSDHEDVIAKDGNVFRPIMGENSVTVVLSAVLTRNYYSSEKKNFTVTVLPFESEQQIIDKLKDSLTFDTISTDSIDEVTNNLYLPEKWYYGSSISWSTDSPLVSVNGENGIVERPEYGNGKVTVKVTANIQYLENTIAKSFAIEIPEKNYLEKIENIWSENCDDWIIGTTDFNSPIGAWTMPDEPNFMAVSDVTNGNNTAISMNVGSNGSGYIRYNYSKELSGYIIAGLRCYVANNNSKIAIEVTSQNGTQVVLNLQRDGLIFTSSSYPASNSIYMLPDSTYPIGEWFDIRFEISTANERFNVYLNDNCITEYGKVYLNDELYDSTLGVPYNYYGNPERPSAMYGFRLSEYRYSALEDDTVYFDDLYFSRKVVYSQNQLDACAMYEKELLKNNNINMLNGNLSIPSVEYDGITVTSASSNTSVLTNGGKITQGDKSKTVEWTVSFDDKITVYKKTFIITIAGTEDRELTDEETVESDLAAVIKQLQDNYLLSNLSANMKLPLVGTYGSAMSYVSSDTSVMTNSGIISRSGVARKTTLTITATQNDAIASKSISVSVSAKTTNTSGGGSGSGGGGTSVSKPSGFSFATGNVASTDTPKQAENAVKNLYTDVDSKHWAYGAINYLSGKNIVSGTDNGAFEPERSVSREEFVKMLAEAMNLTVTHEASKFVDVDSNAWYADYITAVADKNIITGIGNGYFGINVEITREDLAVILYRAANLMPQSDMIDFDDDSLISDYAKEAVYTLKSQGIISGKTDMEFEPKSTATRAEASTMIYRMIKNNLIG